jgi:hypothetical protein
MTPVLKLSTVVHLGGTRISVGFNNGRSGIADLRELLQGLLLAPLRSADRFQEFELNPELGTIAWPNGADLAPEAIYFQAFRSDPNLQSTFQRWGYLGASAPTGRSQR